LLRQRRGVAGNGLGTTIKYLRRTASGAAGSSMNIAIKYLRRTTCGAAENGPLHPPSEGLLLGPLPGDSGKAKYGAWLMACLVLPPKKGDLWKELARNLNAGRYLEDLLVGPCSEHGGRDGKILLLRSSELSVGPGCHRRTGNVGVISRDALFAVLRRFGLPDDFA
jgi:hypothetical protein